MPRTRTVVVATLLVSLLLLATIAAVMLRPIHMPDPAGPYGVGRTTRHVEGDGRSVDLGEGPRARELPVTILYPTSAPAAPRAYVDGPVADALRADMGAFGLIPGAWGLIRASVAADAPPAAGSFPVVTFSPGIGTQPELYTALLADLASRGYVVVAITPPSSVPAAVLSDGAVLGATDVGMNMGPGTPEERTRAREALGGIWADDIRATVDVLGAWNASDPLLRGAFDLARVATIGHSFGGAAAALASELDPRILASANLDGTPLGAPADAGTGKATLLMEDPALSPPQSPDAVARDALVRNASAGYRVTIEGLSHQSFVTDLAVVSERFPFIGDYGERAPREAVRLVASHLAAFLGASLRDEPSALLQARDEGGVRVEAYRA